ncbi:HAD family hydrolase [Mycetocola lacteus]|uniref:HAD family hydrolase n=1 Tax=Mycetocola lacteus TaxID=76637 RepID=A0A3L7AU22_9MICO|nr:HAD family hydrolase [Mycetocola lacteus]RLP83051.1 HAD family hydrolase [Mycetocola lacteus]
MTGFAADRGTTVLFDWNGTVVLDAERARDALNRVLASHGLAALDVQGFSREFHLPMAAMFDRLGIPESAPAERAWNSHMAAAETSAREGVSALRSLHAEGIRLGVISAAFEHAVRSDMVALDLLGLWESVDAPATDKLAVLKGRRGLEETAYYVGDTAYDMRCALAAGFIPVGVDRGYTHTAALIEAGAKRIISSFEELPAIIGATAISA